MGKFVRYNFKLIKMKDKNGIEIKQFDDVLAYNTETDIEFNGTVASFKQGVYVTVLDMEDNYFDIEPENIEVIYK